jgi:hypothetical protein
MTSVILMPNVIMLNVMAPFFKMKWGQDIEFGNVSIKKKAAANLS